MESFLSVGKLPELSLSTKTKGAKMCLETIAPYLFSKIIERLIYNKLFEFLVRYQILFQSQHGLRSGRNTKHATLDCIHSIEEAIESGQYAILVFCDLSKAFDTLNHEILLQKLILKRQEAICKQLNNRKSSCLSINTGVPHVAFLVRFFFWSI